MTAPSPVRSSPPGRRIRRAQRLDARAALPALAGWAAIAWFGLLVSPRLALIAAALIGALALLLLADRPWRASTRHSALRRWGALCAVVTSGMLAACSAQLAARDAGPVAELAEQSAIVQVVAVIDRDPVPIATPARFADQDGPQPAQRYAIRVRIITIEGRGGRTDVDTGAVVLVSGDDWKRVPWQGVVSFSARLAPAEPGSEVVAMLTPRSPPQVQADSPPAITVASAVRGRLRDATASLPGDARGLVPALVVGDTSALPPDLNEAMTATSLTHLNAVSGSNVAVVLACVLGLARMIGMPRRARPLAAGVAVFAFVLLARPEPSVVRAAVMGCVGLVALGSERQRLGLPLLSAAIIGTITVDPWLARSYGFVLSVLATLGLLVLAAPWGEVIGRKLPERLRWVGPVLAVPLAAQVMCTPVTVLLQGSIPTWGVLANLAAAPFVAPATIAGVALALVSCLSPALASLLAWLPGLPCLGIAWVARAFAAAPGAALPWSPTLMGSVALALLSGLAIVSGPRIWWECRQRPVGVTCVLLLVVAAAMPTRVLTWPLPGWQLVACDVGQGDGLVVASGDGRAIVIDAGLESEPIDGCLRRLGITQIDAVILTHFHADHVGGLPGVLRGRQVSAVFVSPIREPPAEAARVDAVAREAGIGVQPLSAGMTLDVGQVHARVWWPARRIDAGSVPNNGSVVLTLTTLAGPTPLTILFTGDVEREAAGEIVRASLRDPAGWPAQIDVLKVAHHGSSNRDDRLSAHTGASLAIISVGADNDYGHPAPRLLTSLAFLGMQVERTDRDGDIAVRKDGNALTVTTAGG